MVVLFVLMIVNNWFVIADGFYRLTNGWSQVYFVSFFVVVNLIILNILISLILDCFSQLRDEMEKQEELEADQANDAGSDDEDEEEEEPMSRQASSWTGAQSIRRESVLRRVLLGDDDEEIEHDQSSRDFSAQGSRQ